jgi:hypothetical protein
MNRLSSVSKKSGAVHFVHAASGQVLARFGVKRVLYCSNRSIPSSVGQRHLSRFTRMVSSSPSTFMRHPDVVA